LGTSTSGALSPFQTTVPAGPLNRQCAFHDVSAPGLHQDAV